MAKPSALRSANRTGLWAEAALPRLAMVGRADVLVALLLGVLVNAGAAPGPAHQKAPAKRPAVDATAIVREMISVYKGASTIQESSAATFTPTVGRVTSQSYFLKFSKPNGLFVKLQDPVNGSLAAYCDGVHLTVYSGATTTYATQPAPPDLAGITRAVSVLARRLTGGDFDQTLNPISFAIADGLPREARGFTLGGVETVQGRRAFVVHCLADEAYLRAMMPAENIRIDRRDLTLYIDVETHYLLKAAGQFKWTSMSRPGENAKSIAVTFRENHVGTRLNAPLPKTAFAFFPPSGAVEVKQ